MSKVLGFAAKIIFAVFSIAIIALLMTLTYQALGRIFPGNFENQIWGLVLFDISAICWALAFVYQCATTGQYAVAAIGFLTGFVGTLGMVAAEVILGSSTVTPEQTQQIGQWMVYGFIAVTALHAALVYAHHATAPKIREQIDIGIARGEITTEAITQATKLLVEQKAELAQNIRNDIIASVKRDIGIVEADPRMPFLPRTFEYPYKPGKEPEVSTLPHPTEEPYAYHRGEPITRAEAQDAVNHGFIDNTGKGGTIPPTYHPVGLYAKPKDEPNAAKSPFPFQPE